MTTEKTTRRAAAARVLVTLDSAGPNESALRILSRLLNPEILDITALYVEDEDVLRAASLPGLREILLSGQEVTLDPARLAGEMASEAAAARRAFEALADRLSREHLRLQHHFLVARGHMAEELDRAAAESDFVMVTRTLRTAGLRARLGRSFSSLVQQPRHVLVVNEPWESGASVVVLAGSDIAMDYASRLAHAEGLRLVVAAPPGGRPADVPPGAALVQLASLKEEAIAQLCLKEDARLLVLPELHELDWAELLVSLIDKLPCSLLKLADR